jgi:hypothetical protein
MRSPSGRVLRDTIDIYYATGIGFAGLGQAQNTISADGGYSPVYPSTPSLPSLACSVQYKKTSESVLDELDRVTEIRTYSILCRQDPLVDPRDMIIYVDNTGNSHTLFVEASQDEAGRGSCWMIHATERR